MIYRYFCRLTAHIIYAYTQFIPLTLNTVSERNSSSETLTILRKTNLTIILLQIIRFYFLR